MLQLRPYQADAIHAVHDELRRGNKRVCACLPCGAGKRYMACHWAQLCHQHGRKCLIVTNRRQLIFQMSDELKRLGVGHGVIMGEVPRNDSEPVQVASLQTIRARHLTYGHGLPPADLILIDEGHQETRAYGRLLVHYPRAAVVGLTATPVGAGGTSLLGVLYDKIVEGVKNSALISKGLLLATRVYAPSEPDIRGVSTSRDEYNQAELGRRVAEVTTWANVFDAWERHQTRQTICFAPGVSYAHGLARQFNSRYGPQTAEVISAQTRRQQRSTVIDAFEDRQVKVLVSVNVLCLDSQTEILTSEGFKGIRDLSSHDEVANWQDGAVYFKKPTLVFDRERAPGEGMVSMTSRFMEIRVTEGHDLLCYSTRGGGSWIKRKAGDVVGGRVQIPVCGVAQPTSMRVSQPMEISARKTSRLITASSYILRQKGMSADDSRREATARVCRKYSLRRLHPQGLTLDQCRFIGFWVGDGRRATLSRGGCQYLLYQSSSYGRIVSWVRDLLQRLPYDFIEYGHDGSKTVAPHYSWSLSRGTGGGCQQRTGVFEIEHFLDKNGSLYLWGLDCRQFDAFVEGLWYADGLHRDAEGGVPSSVLISNTNSQLMNLLQSIACVRNYEARLRKGTPRAHNHAPLFLLRLRKGKLTHNINRRAFLTREHMWFRERVWCVRSHSGAIVTRRNGKISVMGNCEGFDSPIASCGIDLQPNKQIRTYWQKVGRIKRSFEGQSRAVWLDLAGNYWKHPHPDTDPPWLEIGEGGQDVMAEYRARTKPADVACVHCGALRPGGKRCPACGKESEPKPGVRYVRMGRGVLKMMTPDAKKKKTASREQQAWDQARYKAGYSGKTFAFAAWLYKQRMGGWPPESLRNHPGYESPDWQRRVFEVYPWMDRRRA